MKGGVTLDLNKSILENIREVVGLTAENTSFDADLIMHINAAIGKLNQNGIGNIIVVEDATTTWGDLKDITQLEGNKYFSTVPLFVALSTKLLFDPPPPSSVEYHSQSVKEMLWRLKIAYEPKLVK